MEGLTVFEQRELVRANKNPRPSGRGLGPYLDLGANVGRSRTLGTRLSRKTELGAGIQPIEIDRAAAVEEVVVAVFGGDKPESALGDELLDGSRHFVDLLSRTYCLALSRPVRVGPTASALTASAPIALPTAKIIETPAPNRTRSPFHTGAR